MAEPFSIATGIASLISVITGITKVTCTYVYEARNASKKARELDQTLAALATVLEQLEILLKKETSGSLVFKQTSVLFLNYNLCKATLEEIRSKLEAPFRHSVASLVWPFREREHQKTVADIHLLMQIFHYALDVEAW